MHFSTIFANDFCMHCSTISEFRQNWLKNEEKNLNQISLTQAQKSLNQDPTQARSQNPKTDPRPEKRTRPIPTKLTIWVFNDSYFKKDTYDMVSFAR